MIFLVSDEQISKISMNSVFDLKLYPNQDQTFITFKYQRHKSYFFDPNEFHGIIFHFKKRNNQVLKFIEQTFKQYKKKIDNNQSDPGLKWDEYKNERYLQKNQEQLQQQQQMQQIQLQLQQQQDHKQFQKSPQQSNDKKYKYGLGRQYNQNDLIKNLDYLQSLNPNIIQENVSYPDILIPPKYIYGKEFQKEYENNLNSQYQNKQLNQKQQLNFNDNNQSIQQQIIHEKINNQQQQKSNEDNNHLQQYQKQQKNKNSFDPKTFQLVEEKQLVQNNDNLNQIENQDQDNFLENQIKMKQKNSQNELMNISQISKISQGQLSPMLQSKHSRLVIQSIQLYNSPISKNQIDQQFNTRQDQTDQMKYQFDQKQFVDNKTLKITSNKKDQNYSQTEYESPEFDKIYQKIEDNIQPSKNVEILKEKYNQNKKLQEQIFTYPKNGTVEQNTEYTQNLTIKQNTEQPQDEKPNILENLYVDIEDLQKGPIELQRQIFSNGSTDLQQDQENDINYEKIKQNKVIQKLLKNQNSQSNINKKDSIANIYLQAIYNSNDKQNLNTDQQQLITEQQQFQQQQQQQQQQKQPQQLQQFQLKINNNDNNNKIQQQSSSIQNQKFDNNDKQQSIDTNRSQKSQIINDNNQKQSSSIQQQIINDKQQQKQSIDNNKQQQINNDNINKQSSQLDQHIINNNNKQQQQIVNDNNQLIQLKKQESNKQQNFQISSEKTNQFQDLPSNVLKQNNSPEQNLKTILKQSDKYLNKQKKDSNIELQDNQSQIVGENNNINMTQGQQQQQQQIEYQQQIDTESSAIMQETFKNSLKSLDTRHHHDDLDQMLVKQTNSEINKKQAKSLSPLVQKYQDRIPQLASLQSSISQSQMSNMSNLVRSQVRQKIGLTKETHTQLMEFGKILVKGQQFLKYGLNDIFFPSKIIQIFSANLNLFYHVQGKGQQKIKKLFQTIDIIEVRKGRNTINFKRFSKNQKKEDCSLSIILKDRTIDLEAQDMQSRDLYINALTNVLKIIDENPKFLDLLKNLK